MLSKPSVLFRLIWYPQLSGRVIFPCKTGLLHRNHVQPGPDVQCIVSWSREELKDINNITKSDHEFRYNLFTFFVVWGPIVIGATKELSDLTNKKTCYILVTGLSWCGAGSNRRHKDFQSFALPTELPHLPGFSAYFLTGSKLPIGLQI